MRDAIEASEGFEGQMLSLPKVKDHWQEPPVAQRGW